MVVQSKAPGRLDVMGGIADYSGSLVLEIPIRELVTASAALRADNLIRVHSVNVRQQGSAQEVAIQLPSLCNPDGSPNFLKAREVITQDRNNKWALYIIGCLLVLMKEKNIYTKGVDIWIDSEVPIGKGVSSSAAIEVAVLMALCRLYDVTLTYETELPILAQKVENQVVGAACGLMDQITAYLGEANRITPILCQPDLVMPPLTIPDDVLLIGVDSGVKHEVSGSAYSEVRAAAFMGYSIIAQSLGANLADLLACKEHGHREGLPFKGFLANISPEQYEAEFAGILPEKMLGSEFLTRFHTTTDPVTKVDPQVTYQVKACTEHPIYENSRVSLFANLLENLASPIPKSLAQANLREMGMLMYAAHESYSKCGLGNKYTDELVELCKNAAEEHGIFGAKITGGGSGGTVCILGYPKTSMDFIRHELNRYSSRNRFNITIFEGSSSGGAHQLVNYAII